MNPGIQEIHRLALIAGVAWLACQQCAWAQAQTNNIGAGQILETAPPPLPPRSQGVPNVDSSKAQPTAASRSSGPKIKVRGFKLQGNNAIESGVLLALVKAYEGRDLSMDDISEAADLLRDRYRDAGYFLAQALIPSQDVSQGVVEIRIVEGALGQAQAKVAGDARVSESQVQGYLGLLPPGSVITEQSLERPLLLMNDLPGVKVKSVLKPGTAFGSADLDVEVAREGGLFGGSAYADNFGNRNTGEARLGVDLETRGLLGMGDLLTASLFRAGNLTTLGRLGATLPVGPLGTKLSLSYTQLAYDVGGAFAASGANGDGKIVSVLVQHPFIRSRNSNLFLLAGVDYKDISDIPKSDAQAVARKLTLLRLGVNGDFRDGYYGGALNSYTASIFAGNNKIGPGPALDEDQSSINGHLTNGSFTKAQFEFLRLQSLASLLGDGDSLYISLRGQLALNRNLDSSEKGSLGGPRGVRAYPVGAVAGDDLLLLTAEYRHRFADLKVFGANLVFSAFFDHGNAKVFHKPLRIDANNSISLNSIGMGLNVVRKDDFQVRLEVATRVGTKAYEGDESDKRTRGWVQMQKWF